MKTLIQVLKIVILAATLSSVMSCAKKNNRTTNNPVYGNGLYTYNAQGQCINNQTGQYTDPSQCQMGSGYGQQQCNGNQNLYIWSYADQSCAGQMYNNMCWKSCAYTNCSGQVAYPGGSQNMQQGIQCL